MRLLAVMGMCLVGSPAIAGRCGPVRVPKGMACCNDSCGTCVPANDPNAACTLLHCGWGRREIGARPVLVGARQEHAMSLPEMEIAFERGQVGKRGVMRLWGGVRIPLSQAVVVTVASEAEGRGGSQGGWRRERVGTGLVWTLPSGSPGRHLGALLSGRLERVVRTPSGGVEAAFGRPAERGAFAPQVGVGGAVVQRVPFAIGSASGRVWVGSPSEPALGYTATATLSGTLWGNNPLGFALSAEVDRPPGGRADVHAPANVSVVVNRTVQFSAEAGPTWWNTDEGWTSGAMIGLRVAAYGEAGRLISAVDGLFERTQRE